MVVHGTDGLDELTTTEETVIAELKKGAIKTYAVKPEDFGLKRGRKDDLKGGDAAFNAKVARSVLKGEKGAKSDIVMLNAGAAICVTGLAGTIKEGIKKAEESINSGRALKKLEKLRELTNT